MSVFVRNDRDPKCLSIFVTTVVSMFYINDPIKVSCLDFLPMALYGIDSRVL